MTRVLIADDHPIVRSGVEGLLKDTAFVVVGALGDGMEVLENLPRLRPDILLLDVDMPRRSGLDVLRVLRSKGDQRSVVLLTASLATAGAIEAIQLGVNGIVLKETAPALLLSCLDAVKNGRKWIERSILEEALNTALTDEQGAGGRLGSLSPKERAIANLVSQGLRNKDIAAELGITEGTVKVHLHRVYEKINITNRTELAMAVKASS
jgi:two-component system nitrate/nitrite response regulator NarP